jgi:hypothetical protein
MNGRNTTTIDAKDLLQANATIIAGVVVFLTIAVSFSTSFNRPFPLISVIMIALGTIPFIFSCDHLLRNFEDPTHGFRWAKGITRLGLYYLVGTIASLLAISQYVRE